MLHSRRGNFSYALHMPHEQEELQRITPHYILYSNHLFIYFILTENSGCHNDTVTDIHRQSQTRNGVLVYRIVQNT